MKSKNAGVAKMIPSQISDWEIYFLDNHKFVGFFRCLAIRALTDSSGIKILPVVCKKRDASANPASVLVIADANHFSFAKPCEVDGGKGPCGIFGP